MGGPGSTRWLHHRRKPLAEESLRLDVEHIATQAARDPSRSSGILVWPSGGDLPHATARFTIGENYRGRYLGLELANARPHQAGLHTVTLWLTELRTFRRSRRILAVCPGCEGRMAKAYWPPGEWTAGFACRRCTGITDASNRREDKRVNEFRRRPDLALHEIETNGPRARLALDSLPSWFTGSPATRVDGISTAGSRWARSGTAPRLRARHLRSGSTRLRPEPSQPPRAHQYESE